MKGKTPAAKSKPALPKGAPAVMIMIGMKPHEPDADDKGKMSVAPRPSNRGKVPSFAGQRRRTWTGS